MTKPLVLVVIGTRPEAIKLASVVRALEAGGKVDCRIAATAQHRKLLDQMLGSFELRASYDLNLMRPGQTLNGFASRALAGLGELFARLKPALVVVQGDTTTALCGALAASQERIPIAHVEAGLRTFDRDRPFPEEANRVVIDDLSGLLFAPTAAAARNFRRPGLGRVFVTGNTGVDALRWAQARPRPVSNKRLAELLSEDEPLILLTMHRRESVGAGVESVCRAARAILERNASVRIVSPAHPRFRAMLARGLRHPRAQILPPLDYFDAVTLLRRCRFVMTDSGGLQEEAATLGKPVLVLRELTDRPEAVRVGVAKLVGFNGAIIAREANRLIKDERFYRRMAKPSAAFGDGRAGPRIAAQIRRFLRMIGR